MPLEGINDATDDSRDDKRAAHPCPCTHLGQRCCAAVSCCVADSSARHGCRLAGCCLQHCLLRLLLDQLLLLLHHQQALLQLLSACRQSIKCKWAAAAAAAAPNTSVASVLYMQMDKGFAGRHDNARWEHPSATHTVCLRHKQHTASSGQTDKVLRNSSCVYSGPVLEVERFLCSGTALEAGRFCARTACGCCCLDGDLLDDLLRQRQQCLFHAPQLVRCTSTALSHARRGRGEREGARQQQQARRQAVVERQLQPVLSGTCSRQRVSGAAVLPACEDRQHLRR